MTVALTSVGVQQVSITIASGSLTGTATVTAVGSGSWLTLQGWTATDATGQLDDTTAYVTISGTTITAQRGVTGSSKTMVVNCSLTDGNTTNLVNTVQYGTVTVTSGFALGTATISAVTAADSVIGNLGQDTASSVSATTGYTAQLTWSGTTVTATVNGTATVTATVAFVLIQFQGAALNSSTQQKNITQNIETSVTTSVTISSVTIANAMLFYGGQQNGSGSPNSDFNYWELTTSTNLSGVCNTTQSESNTITVSVAEFVSGMLAQSVQRGTLSLSSATSKTATITSSPTAATLCNWMYNNTSAASIDAATCFYRLTQTSATVVTMNVNSSATGVGAYEAINFNAPAVTGRIFMQWLPQYG